MKNLRGFTIIELMITVVIASILLTIGVPSFQNLIRENRLATQANEFITALNMARSEAIRRGQNVTVTANGGNWNNGWVVTTIDPATAAVTTLRTFDTVGHNLSFSGGTASYTYLPSGFKSNMSLDTYGLCDTSVSGKRGRQIFVSPSGRPRIDQNEYIC
jgi:type IV fimbrial biogenesis protein FimT